MRDPGLADFGPWTLDFGHFTAGADVAEKSRRERLLRHLESADKAHPLELAKYSLQRAGATA
jgi:hypothetical protein